MGPDSYSVNAEVRIYHCFWPVSHTQYKSGFLLYNKNLLWQPSNKFCHLCLFLSKSSLFFTINIRSSSVTCIHTHSYKLHGCLYYIPAEGFFLSLFFLGTVSHKMSWLQWQSPTTTKNSEILWQLLIRMFRTCSAQDT